MSDEEQSIVKAYVLGDEVDTSNAVATAEDSSSVFSSAGALIPPYDPQRMSNMFERSTSLRPNIDVYATNIEAFGHRMVPTIDLKRGDADERVLDALALEKLHEGKPAIVTPDEVKVAKLELAHSMRLEQLSADLFFDHCCTDISFIELRMRTRQDLEVTGNAYWEVLRNNLGEIAQFVHVPSVHMRLMRADSDYTEVELQQKISAISYRRVKTKRRFRRYVQSVNGQDLCFFKELDDPRAVSAKRGRVYDDVAALEAAEGRDAKQATEMIHFKIHSPTTAYGVPRWVGATLAVLGSRASEEVNVIYFDNKAVPPLAILVSGGTLAAGAADRIKTYIRDQIKGRDNFHSILIIEAAGSSEAVGMGAAQSRIKVELKPLRDAMQQDALFQEYEANNTEKVGNQFRLPKILRGDMADFNRATAEAALMYAEQQVFQPERNRIDHLMNKRILPHRGIRFHEFATNSHAEKDPPALSLMVSQLVEACIITPEEARSVLGDVLGKELKQIDAPWVRIPGKLLMANIQPPPTEEELAAAKTKGDKDTAPTVQLAPTDAITILTVNEARASLRLGPLKTINELPDPRGNLSVFEFQNALKPAAPPGLPGAPPGLPGAPGAPAPSGLPGAPPRPPALGGGVDLGFDQGASLEEQAMNLIRLKLALEQSERSMGVSALALARKQEAEQTIEVPASEFSTWFVPQATE